jgi:hypothetical protein
MTKLYALLLALSCATLSFAQSTANYAVSSATNGSLALDLNGNTVDMTTGTTLLAAASSDQPTATVTNIGFNFVFMGTVYTQFSATANGVIRLGSTVVGTGQYTVGLASAALISPFGGDLETSSTGKVHSKVVGTAPNRVLVIEFLNMGLDYTGSYQNPDGTFQARLYESTGVIEYVYGSMNVNGSTVNSTGFTIGFSSGTAAAGTIMSITNTATNAFSTSAVTILTPTRPTVTTGPPYQTIPIADLNSTSDGSRKVYRFTPPVPTAPTGLTFTAVTMSSMNLTWVDNSTGEFGYFVQRSTDGINYITVATLAPNTTTYAATGLSGSTTYYWRVSAYSEGALSNAATGSQATVTGILSGVKTVGTGGDYPNLTSAFAAINTSGLSGNITLQLITGYPASPETYPIVSSTSVVGPYSVTVYPTVSGLSITSASTTGTLNLNNATNIIIDGRINGTGSTPSLLIANTSTGYAVQYINDATANTIRFATLQGTATSVTSGVIVFSTTTGLSGNSNNLITDCQIRDGATTPSNGIYSSGTAAVPNTNNTVTNSSIFNFFAAAVASNGILLSTGSTNWTITNNHFYQTAARTSTAGSTHSAITINNSTGVGFVISNNNIGGSATGTAGTAWTLGGAFGNKLIGISLTAGTSTVSSIQGNTIANINLSSTSSATTAGGVFAGIYIGGGFVNIGTTTANTIGSGTGTGSIAVIPSSNSGGAVYGIYSVSSNTVVISNNVIGSISITNPTTSNATYESFYAIRVTSGTNTISGNLIGSSTTAMSINNAAGSTSTALHAAARGISAESGTSSVVTNNTISNIGYSAAGTQGQVQGINITSGTNTVSGNVIYSLSNSSANAGTGTAVAIMGIYYGSSTAPATVSQNTIYDLSSSAASAAVTVRGLYYGGPTSGTNLVSRNFIHSFSTTSTSTTASIEGIYIASGIGTFQNNMIRLGVDKTGAALTNGSYVGIDKVGTSNVNLYHNSVYIGGTGVSVSANSIAFRRTGTATDDVRNNIFVNARSNGTGTGKHYAIGINATTTLTSDYNLLFVNGTGGLIGYNVAPGATDYATLGAWSSATALDVNSISSDPKFVAPNGSSATVDLHVLVGSPVESTGVVIAAVTDDYDGQTRASLSPADIGADAGNFIIPGLNVGITALTSPATTGCYTSNEPVKVTLKNYGSAVQDFSVNPVTVTVSATGPVTYNSSIVVNSGTLATNATQTITLPATINLTGQGTYSFTASATVSGDINTANDTFYSARTSLVISGVKTVGTGGDYPTLTAAITAYNNATCFTGPVVFSLLNATYPSETFPITINQNAYSGSNTLTIRPAAGVNAVISGSGTALIKLNGADNVIIDGSNNGTSTRNLTLQNTSTSSSTTAIWVASLGTAAGAQNDMIRNVVIQTGFSSATTYGIFVGGTSVGSSGNDNDNLTISNNLISKAYYGIYVAASSTAGANDNLVLSDNVIGSDIATDYIGYNGIQLIYAQGATISGNTVYNIITSASNPIGIYLNTNVLNSTLDRNTIHTVRYTGTSGYGGKGIDINTGSATSNLTITNNMVSDISGDGYTTFTSDAIVGIRLLGTSGAVTIDNNTVNLSGSVAGYNTATVSAALYISSTATNITVRNNILSSSLDNTTVTTDKTYAIYSAAASTAFTTIDYNDYYVSGAAGVLGYLASDRTTLAALQTGFGGNVNSKNIQPFFVSATDPHIDATLSYLLDNLGTSLPNVSIDIDGDPRDPATPDIGADEFTTPPACSGAIGGNAVATASVFCNSGATTITATNFSVGPITSYQWESSPDGTTWTPISGQTNANSVSTGTITSTTHYRLKVTCNTGTAIDYSNDAVVTINPNPVFSVTPASPAICPGGSVVLTASGTSNTYVWAPATGLSATTGATVTASPTSSTSYTVTGTITATGCTATNSTQVVVLATPTPITITPAAPALCSSDTAKALTINGGVLNMVGTTGTSASTTSTNGITPYSSVYEGAREQYLVRASELTALGLSAGNLTTLSFKVTSAGAGTVTQKNFTIKMAHTAQQSLASAYGTPVGGFTTVYTNVAGEPAPAVGTKTYALTTFFAWDGVSNILIDICHDNDPTATCTSCFSSNTTVAATTTSFSSVWGSYADNLPACGVQNGATITTTNLRPDMTFGFVSPFTRTWTPTTGLFTDAAATTAYTTGSAVATVYAHPAVTTTYTATVTSSSGCSASGTVTLAVSDPVVITTQPVAQSACPGSPVTFSVLASNAASYQWRKDGVDIAGATSASFTIGSVSAADAASYTVSVAGASPCGAVVSAAATLTVFARPSSSFNVTSPVCAGTVAAFTNTSTIASGSIANSFWNFGDGVTSATTNATHTYANPGVYTAVLTSESNNGCRDSFTMAVLVNAPVAITGALSNQAVCAGTNATFTVTATGTGITYQWKKDGVIIAGATSNTYTISAAAAANAGVYRVVVSGTCNADSSQASLIVNPVTVITTQPSSLVVCAGAAASFTTAATGTAITYQWNKNGVAIAGATSASYTIATTTAADAGSYTVTVTGTCGVLTSTAATLTVNAVTAINTQPISQTVCAGAGVTFTVAASGTALTYQWKKDGTDITGATASTYSIAATSAASAGIYTVVVTGTCGTVTSAGATLTINAVTVITTQPTSQTVCAGAAASFTVAATGTALSYQWKKDGTNITGATSATYSIAATNAASAGVYTVVVTGTCGTVTSTNATLTVNDVTAITTQPSAQAVCAGTSTTFTVVATGTALSYQWKKDGTNITGATSSAYGIASAGAADAGIYSVIVTGTCGVVTSANAALTVNAVTVITTQPASQTVCAGTAFSFTVAATGTSLGYQWKKDGTNITGATSATYSVTSATAASAGVYTVVVTGTCGTITSANATLTVNAVTAITTQPAATLAVCAGTSASFTVAATGTSLTYQWKKGGTDIAGATSATYTIASTSATDAATYTVVVTGTCGTVTSSNAVLTVNSVTVISTQPAATQTVCAGTAATFTVAATGTALSYQWKKNGTDITGATSATYSIASTTAADAATYTVVVTGTCGTVTSANAVLTVNAITAITTQPVAQTACPGTSVTFTVAASGSGTLSYQWKKAGTDITGATSASYTIGSVTAADAASYTVVVTGSCGTVTSAAAALTVNTTTGITTQPAAAQTVCAGSGVTFTVAATGTALSYQWKKAGADITGATSATYTIASATAGDAATYTVVITGACGTVTSANAVLTVNAVTAIGTQPATQAVCSGSAATFTVAATGTGLSYQWKKNGTDITGATAATYSIAAATAADAATYTVVVTGTCGTVTSASAVLTVNAITAISTQPAAAQTVCAGSGATFTVAATGVGLTYQWKKAGVNIAGATAATYMIGATSAADAATYTVTVTGTCGTVTSANAVLAVNAATVIGTQPAVQAVCAGAAASFSVAATGTGLSFQWKKNGTDIAGATINSYSIASVTAADVASYTVVVTGTCGTITSSAAALTLNTAVTIGTQPQAITACQNTPAAFTVAASGTGPLAYQWRKDGVAISGATSSAYTIASVTAADVASYSVVVTGACGAVTSAAAPLTMGTCITASNSTLGDMAVRPSLAQSQTRIVVRSLRVARIQWQLVDAKGDIVRIFNQNVVSGANEFRLDLYNLAAGVYYLRGFSPGETVPVLRFVKQ